MSAKLKDDWTALRAEPVSLTSFQTFTVNDDRLAPGSTFRRTTKEVASARISPGGTQIGIVDDAAGDSRLVVLDLHGHSKVVARNVCKYPDWEPAGHGLKFLMEDDDSEGYLARVDLDSGQITHLCPAHFEKGDRVRCLKDSSVLFANLFTGSSRPDFVKKSVTKVEVLWLWKPEYAGPKHLAVRSHRDGCGLCVFEVSPSQETVTLPGSSGGIDLLALKTRKITSVIVDDGPGLSAPCWRGDTELSFTRSSPTRKNAKQFVTWSMSTNEIKSLSDAWPYEAVAGLLEERISDKSSMSLTEMLNDLKWTAPGQ